MAENKNTTENNKNSGIAENNEQLWERIMEKTQDEYIDDSEENSEKIEEVEDMLAGDEDYGTANRYSQTIELAADRARYDECAKKLLTYKAVIAWILKSCTKEFSQYSVKFICDNCLNENVELSEHAVHQDQLNRDERLNGDKRLHGLNTEANAVKDQTVYYDIRFKATLPESKEPVQLIINLEIQLNDTPGYPLVTRGFYYCARMISEQYGTVFTDEHYEKIQKVYSIWICPDPAKKRKNGIFRYHTVEDSVRGNSFVKSEAYDLMEVVILNLGDADESSDLEILDLLNVLFSTTATPEEKKKRLNDDAV